VGREPGVPPGVYSQVYLRVCIASVTLFWEKWAITRRREAIISPVSLLDIPDFLVKTAQNPVKSPLKPGTGSPSAQGRLNPGMSGMLRYPTLGGLPPGLRRLRRFYAQNLIKPVRNRRNNLQKPLRNP